MFLNQPADALDKQDESQKDQLRTLSKQYAKSYRKDRRAHNAENFDRSCLTLPKSGDQDSRTVPHLQRPDGTLLHAEKD